MLVPRMDRIKVSLLYCPKSMRLTPIHFSIIINLISNNHENYDICFTYNSNLLFSDEQS
jgi:hypothetical protein